MQLVTTTVDEIGPQLYFLYYSFFCRKTDPFLTNSICRNRKNTRCSKYICRFSANSSVCNIFKITILRTTQTSSTPLQFKKNCKQSSIIKKVNSLISFMLRNWRSISSSWLDRLRISDRKFVNHTTEMILWSMILICRGFLKSLMRSYGSNIIEGGTKKY